METGNGMTSLTHRSGNGTRDGTNQGYILSAMERVKGSGHTCIPIDRLYRICQNGDGRLNTAQFNADVEALTKKKTLRFEHGLVYPYSAWEYETTAARLLDTRLRDNHLQPGKLPEIIRLGEIVLDESQRRAVHLALSHRLSMIMGGAGTGKTTIIRAIRAYCGAAEDSIRICATTGKAARTLLERARLPARTLHSVMHIAPDESYLEIQRNPGIRLLVVDEASMLSIGMLAGILLYTPANCRIVLIGDSNQLPSVEAGNVIGDLIALGVPHVRLMHGYRVRDKSCRLEQVVKNFSDIRGMEQMGFDDGSMLFEPAQAQNIRHTLCDIAAAMYGNGGSVQVLSRYNEHSDCSVKAINGDLQRRVNPAIGYVQCGKCTFHDGDRVIIRSNDRERGCMNGDTGILRLNLDGSGFTVDLDAGGRARYDSMKELRRLELAYAITIHKSQGSQYDTVILPVGTDMGLDRSTMYTAISRARMRVILVGDPKGIEMGLKRTPPRRRSMLVERTRRLMKAAS